jgi:hypothetical protein
MLYGPRFNTHFGVEFWFVQRAHLRLPPGRTLIAAQGYVPSVIVSILIQISK